MLEDWIMNMFFGYLPISVFIKINDFNYIIILNIK